MAEPGPRRFYERAAAEPAEGGFALTLDGRPARTPRRLPLVLPTRALGEAIAAEWDGQGATVNPATMPLTRLANVALDGVAPEVEAVRDDIARYAASDLVAYRAGEPERLVAEQAAAWDPILAWARAELGLRFVLSEGVTFVEQPPESLARVRSHLVGEASPFRLAALHSMTTLTGSVLLALMRVAGAIGDGEAWGAAHVDEFHQESLWGADEDALARRHAREAEFRAASLFHELAGGRPPAPI